MRRKSNAIAYDVFATPKRSEDEVQAYHVRAVERGHVDTDDLARHIEEHSAIDRGTIHAVLIKLQAEMVEHLLGGFDIHLNGIGRFSLQLGTVKEQDADGHWQRKTYTDPKQLRSKEICVEGVTYRPDREMLRTLRSKHKNFERVKRGYQQEITRSNVLTAAAHLCQEQGCFSRSDFEKALGVSRYVADKTLTELVNEPYPKYYRQRVARTFVYRKTGT